MMESIFKILESLIQPTVILLILIVLLILNSWIFNKIKSTSSSGNITKGAISFFLILLSVLIFILVLPIDKSLKGQILTFLAIIISAGIALSSTTILGNLIAGIMNNSMEHFRNGDLIMLNDFHGRVIKKSIFHTIIQLEDSSKYFSTNSLLNATAMDKLHAEKIEIKKDYLKEIDKKQTDLKEKLKNLKDDKEIEKIKSAIKKNDELKERVEKNILEQIERDEDAVK